MVEVTEWLVGISCHFLDFGIDHMCLLRRGRNGTEDRRSRRCIFDVEMVDLEWRFLHSIGMVVDGECLLGSQCRVSILKGTSETLATIE